MPNIQESTKQLSGTMRIKQDASKDVKATAGSARRRTTP